MARKSVEGVSRAVDAKFQVNHSGEAHPPRPSNENSTVIEVAILSLQIYDDRKKNKLGLHSHMSLVSRLFLGRISILIFVFYLYFISSLFFSHETFRASKRRDRAGQPIGISPLKREPGQPIHDQEK